MLSAMTAFRFPTVFLSHGTPMLAYGEDRYQEALHGFAKALPRPKAIVVLSAHSVSIDAIHILRTEKNTIQHDFSGFPRPLYEIQYSCPGSPELSDQIAGLFKTAGFEVKLESQAPLDHGVWIPLLHLYPEGDIPVVRISLPLNLLPAQIMKMGRTLAPLREQGILILASGGAVHNLQELQWANKNSPGAEWAVEFETWIVESLKSKNVEAILHFEDHPGTRRAHPSHEHFLPVLFSVGAALPGDDASVIFRGVEYETLSMLCFSLNPAESTSEKPLLH
jgi:4,5-DOPA dioxygenase extradiol